MAENGNNYNFFLNKYKNFSKENIKSYSVVDKEGAKEDKSKTSQNDPQKTTFEKLEVKELPSVISKKKLSAIFLIIIGIDEASEVIKHFNETELFTIINEIIATNNITEAELREVNNKFGNIRSASPENFRGGMEYARALLQKAFGLEEGSKLLVKSIEIENKEILSLSFMNRLPSKSIMDIIKEESDSVISIILGMMDSKKSAEIIKFFPTNRSINLVRLISKKAEITPQILKTIAFKLKDKVSSVLQEDKIKIKGKEKLVDILKNSSMESSSLIIKNLEIDDPHLAEELKDKIFTFNDVLKIPRKSLIIALKGYKDKDIAFFLKGAQEELKAIFLSCMTKKRSDIILEEIDYLGKVKKKDVDIKRKEFIKYLRQLEDLGKVIIKPDDEIYVE